MLSFAFQKKWWEISKNLDALIHTTSTIPLILQLSSQKFDRTGQFPLDFL